MLVVPRVRGHLCHLSFSDLERKDPAHPLTLGMDFEHDARGRRPVEAEELLQHVDHEFHRSVVVIEQHHLIQRWLLDLGPRLLDENTGIGTGRMRVGHDVFIGVANLQHKPAIMSRRYSCRNNRLRARAAAPYDWASGSGGARIPLPAVYRLFASKSMTLPPQ